MLFQQVHERAAPAPGAVRDGHVVHPVRGVRRPARVHGPAPLLHRALGPRGVAAASTHLLQPPRPAALPNAAPAAREAVASRRRNQHLRHRMNTIISTTDASLYERHCSARFLENVAHFLYEHYLERSSSIASQNPRRYQFVVPTIMLSGLI